MQPQTKVVDLVNNLIRFTRNTERTLSQESAQPYVDELNKLKKDALYYYGQALIHRLTGKPDLSLTEHKKALEKAKDIEQRTVIQNSLIASFIENGYFTDASNFCLSQIEQTPNSVKYLDYICNIAKSSMSPEYIDKAMSIAKNIPNDYKLKLQNTKEEIKIQIGIVNDIGVSKESFVHSLSVLSRTTAKKYLAEKRYISIFDDRVNIKIFIDLELKDEEIIDINDRFIENLASTSFDGNFSELLKINCTIHDITDYKAYA